MSLVEFFFNGNYRESLQNTGQQRIELSGTEERELKPGMTVQRGAFKVFVTEVYDDCYKGVIIEQAYTDIRTRTSYVNSEHEFVRYDKIIDHG